MSENQSTLILLSGLAWLLASLIAHHTAQTLVLKHLFRGRMPSARLARLLAPQRSADAWRSSAGKLIAQMIVGFFLAKTISQAGPADPSAVWAGVLLAVFLIANAAALWGTLIGVWMLVISAFAPSEADAPVRQGFG